MTNLIQLHLNHNYFTGPIPEFDGATNLEDIGLSSNKLTGMCLLINSFYAILIISKPNTEC